MYYLIELISENQTRFETKSFSRSFPHFTYHNNLAEVFFFVSVYLLISLNMNNNENDYLSRKKKKIFYKMK